MRKSRHFMNMPVFSMEEGQQIGTVKGLVVDAARKAVAALIVEQKGWFKEQKFIPFNLVYSVGEDAVTVERNSSVEKGTGLPEILKLAKNRIEIIGARMVSENGVLLGQVDEYYVELKNGNIIGLEFSGGFFDSFLQGRAFLDSNFIRTIGKQVVICTDDALDNIVKLEGGLQESMRNFRETTSQVWLSTVQKSKDLGSVLNRPFKRNHSAMAKAKVIQVEEKPPKDQLELDESGSLSEKN